MAELTLFGREKDGYLGFADCIADLREMAGRGPSCQRRIPIVPRISRGRGVTLPARPAHRIGFVQHGQQCSRGGPCEVQRPTAAA